MGGVLLVRVTDAGSIARLGKVERAAPTGVARSAINRRIHRGIGAASRTDGERGVSRRMRRTARTTSACLREAPGERQAGERLQARARPARAITAGVVGTPHVFCEPRRTTPSSEPPMPDRILVLYGS